MLVGEIGIPRREFLFDIQYWEVVRIIRGYRRRDTLKHQLMAECAYAAMFSMRDPKGKTVVDMFPFLFEDEDEDDDTPILSDEEIDDLRALMRSNSKKAEK